MACPLLLPAIKFDVLLVVHRFTKKTDFESSCRGAPAGAWRRRGAAGFDSPRRKNRTSTVRGGPGVAPPGPFFRPGRRGRGGLGFKECLGSLGCADIDRVRFLLGSPPAITLEALGRSTTAYRDVLRASAAYLRAVYDTRWVRGHKHNQRLMAETDGTVDGTGGASAAGS